jgi:hypothetical protein
LAGPFAHLEGIAAYQDEFKRILDEGVGDYAIRALALLAQAIQAKGLVLSEELLRSLRTQVMGPALS